MQRRIETKNLRDRYIIERNPGRQRGDINNNNAAADAVKTRNRGHDAMTAGEARELAHAAREEHNVHFQGDSDASAVVDGAKGGSDDAVDFSAPLPLRKPRIEATQFKWTQLQVGGPAPGFRGTVRGEEGRRKTGWF